MASSHVDSLLAEADKHRKNQRNAEAVEIYKRILLDRGDADSRIIAVRALGEMRFGSPALIESLNLDPEPKVRRTIVQILANFQGPTVSTALQIAAVADTDLEVRLYAALIELYFKQPNLVSGWLARLASRDDSYLRSVVGEAQVFANRLVNSAGHVFISYSHKDAEQFTLQLVDTLRKQFGFRVWIDTNLVPGSPSWKRAIALAIEQCSFLLLILSPQVHNPDSFYIDEELAYAEQLGKERLYVKYIDTHKPFGLSQMQGLRNDLTFQDYPEEMLSALVEELTRRNIARDENL